MNFIFSMKISVCLSGFYAKLHSFVLNRSKKLVKTTQYIKHNVTGKVILTHGKNNVIYTCYVVVGLLPDCI